VGSGPTAGRVRSDGLARKRREIPLWILPLVPGLLLYLAFYVPSLIVLLVLSFYTYVPGSTGVPDFTFSNYSRFFDDSYYTTVLLHTCYLSAIASFIATILGYPLAFHLVRSSKLRRIILPVVALSFFVSAIVVLYGWLNLLARGGPLNKLLVWLGVTSQPIPFLYTDKAVVIGLAGFALPFAILVLASSISNLDESLEEAAQNLGATRWQTLVRITIPLTFPGLLGSLILGFVFSFSAVVTPVILGGGLVPMMATVVYTSMVEALNYPFASASVMMIAITVFVVTVTLGRVLKTRVH
jgi:ABC-type spermidine/putrescine transport system permease subunit I